MYAVSKQDRNILESAYKKIYIDAPKIYRFSGCAIIYADISICYLLPSIFSTISCVLYAILLPINENYQDYNTMCAHTYTNAPCSNILRLIVGAQQTSQQLASVLFKFQDIQSSQKISKPTTQKKNRLL